MTLFLVAKVVFKHICSMFWIQAELISSPAVSLNLNTKQAVNPAMPVAKC